MEVIDLKIRELKAKINQQIGECNALRTKKEQVELRLMEIDTKIQTHENASIFLQTLSDETRQMIINKMSNIVTDALKQVLDKNLAFEMQLSTERNQVDIKFLVKDTTMNKSYEILNSFGGGLADIVSFPLRVSLLLKWSPQLSRVLIMDETFKAVDVTNQAFLGEFIRQLSEKLRLQIILVTHSSEIASKAHKQFKVNNAKGVSTVNEA
ncbi:MAG: hypothetical protein V3U54_08945 [Thermodesulfobacteriota bacterium]